MSSYFAIATEQLQERQSVSLESRQALNCSEVDLFGFNSAKHFNVLKPHCPYFSVNPITRLVC
jgi:hypothetical protein